MYLFLLQNHLQRENKNKLFNINGDNTNNLIKKNLSSKYGEHENWNFNSNIDEQPSPSSLQYQFNDVGDGVSDGDGERIIISNDY